METPSPDRETATPEAAQDAAATVPALGVTPFWERMPRLFAFPFQRPPLQRNVLATLAFCIVMSLALPQLPAAPLRSIALLLVGWISTSLYMASYAFLVIERSSVGYLDSRGYPKGDGDAHPWRPVKMFLVMVCVPLVIVVLGALGLPGALVVLALLLFALLLPASVMVLTMTDSFAEAVNPARCANTAMGIGPPYLLLCLFLMMLWISSRQAISLLLGGPATVPGAGVDLQAARGTLALSIFIYTLVQNYFLVLTCALIGYAMYQYGGVLGIAVVGPGETQRPGSTSAAAHERRIREALIGKMIAGGEFREAMELLSDELRQRPNDLSLHVRLHAVLLQEGSRPRIEDHAARYLELLLAAGNLKDALALFEKTREMFPDFLPREPARLPQLAGAAIDAANPKLAAQLVRGFDKKYPGHASIPEVYVVGARILLLTQRQNDAKALLQHVTKSYPDNPAAAQARRFLARFEPGAAAQTLPGPARFATMGTVLTGPAARRPPEAPPLPRAAVDTAPKAPVGAPPPGQAATPTPSTLPPTPIPTPTPALTPAPIPAPILPQAPVAASMPIAEPEPEFMVEDVAEPGPYPDIFLEAEPELPVEPAIVLAPLHQAPLPGAEAVAVPEPLPGAGVPEERKPEPAADSAPPSYLDLVLEPGERPAPEAPAR